MKSETCYHCVHADFKAESESTMRGFAKCGKARNTEERAKYYFGGYKCDKGKFEAAPAATMAKRRSEFEKWRTRK
nr:MAG TPA: hypothetical protein [Caudoviricetes sp.]